ncbi:MAG: DUF4115 domain-containing protein [Gammaproteobacteria bacterium]|nr:DUF4115 domain-containing protein [Gammaproteobacteria bacterium]
MTEIPETEPRVTQRAPGDILKHARQGKNLSIAAIATQLNLDLRTVEALENGDLSKLPAPIFVRGYLRGYARLVDVREDDVLAAYQALAPQEPAPRAVSMAHRPMRPAFLIPSIPWRGLLSGVVLIGLVLLAMEIGPQILDRLTSGDTTESAPATGLALPVPTGEAVTDELPQSMPATDNLSLALPEPTPSAVDDLQSPAIEEIEPTTPSDIDFGVPSAADTEVVAVAPVLPPDQVQLDINFISDSWVEIRAADRSKLVFGLLRKGEQRSVTGQAPISVLFGNASAVTLKVNGEMFDYAQFTNGNIARFTVPVQP